MSAQLINLNDDLKKLRDEGYEVEVKEGFLIAHSIPYVNAGRQIYLGKIISNLELSGEKTVRPKDHTVWFQGEVPCKANGQPISGILHSQQQKTLFDDFKVNYYFSNKPKGGYVDYYQKITSYIGIITNEAKAISPNATAQTFKPISSNDESVFHYSDTASSRYGITGLASKFKEQKIAIIGLGGTGSYILDMVSKTHVKEIHLFDGDYFLQHNAFRAPSAVSIQELREQHLKVDYYKTKYSKLRKGIYGNAIYIDDSNTHLLNKFDFVFVCVDNPVARGCISEHLIDQEVPFIDVGMGVEVVEETSRLIGTCRVTLCTPQNNDHFTRHVSTRANPAEDDYNSDVQVVDLNVLNASLAVLKWKKYLTYYDDQIGEHQSCYALNTHQLSREENKKYD